MKRPSLRPASPHESARRAFAGDEGILPDLELTPQPAAVPVEAPILQFILKLTAVAAAILFCLALAIRDQSLPESDDLGAVEDYSEVLEDLERLNEAEASRLGQSTLEDSKVLDEEHVRSPRRVLEVMDGIRPWIAVLVLTSFLAGGAGGVLVGLEMSPPAPVPGAYFGLRTDAGAGVRSLG